MTLEVHRFRLSAMMFGQYLIIGSWAVTLGTFLMASPSKGGLHFPATYVGWIYSTLAIAGIVAPFFIGLLADRLFAAEKLLGCLHLLSAVLLGGAAWWCLTEQPKIASAYRAAAAQEAVDGVPILELEKTFAAAPGNASEEQRQLLKQAFERVDRSPHLAELLEETFSPLFALMLGYAFCYVTTVTLCNVIVFRNLNDLSRSFGNVRLFGTVGWIVAGLVLAAFWNIISPGPLFFAAALSVAFGLLCFGLPSTPPAGYSRSLADALGLRALAMFRERSFTVVIVGTLLVAAIQQFYSVYANRYLVELHVSNSTAVQTLAQVSEVTCMFLFPYVLPRIGLKATMAIGLACWILRNGFFASESRFMVILGLPLHGISYAFFVTIASLYVDRKAHVQLRASAQGIYTFALLGAGNLLGNWLSSRVVESQTLGDIVAWRTVWLVPAALSLATLVGFLVLFRDSIDGPVRSSEVPG